MKRKLFIPVLLFLIPLGTMASHIVGGVMNYKCLGNDQYQVTLKVYRDCINGNVGFDVPAYIGIYTGGGTLVQVVTATSPQISIIPPAINNPCFTPPNNVCVEEGIYNITISLPANLTGYYLVYQRCCRNSTIMNLINPGNVGSTYYAFVPPASQVPCNSNPVFDNFPPIFLCANVAFQFDHSATDINGDSLTYELCDPVMGASVPNPWPSVPSPPPFTPVPWSGTFTSGYAITSSPAIQINQQTGLLTLTPTQLGQFVVGICVKEYKNGVLISSTLRDFQFNVVNCPGLVVASFPGQTTYCNGFNVSFSNNSYNATSYHWDFGVTSLTNDTSNQAMPTYTYPGPGTYTVKLIANPYTTCADTAVSVFTIEPPINPGFVLPPPQCATGNSYNFTPTGNFGNNASFTWTFQSGSPGSSTIKEPANISFPGGGTYPVKIKIKNGNCTDSTTTNITVLHDPVAAIKPQDEFCKGTTLTFKHQSQHSNGFFWDFGDLTTLADTSLLASPSYTYPDTGNYTVMLIADNGVCSDTTFRNFSIRPLLEVKITASDTEQCLEGNKFSFFASGAYEPTATLLWQFGTSASVQYSNSDTVNNVNFKITGEHPVTLTASDNGCTSSDIVVIKIYPPPQASFDPVDPGCLPYEVRFHNTSTGATSLYYLWDFGDGTTSTEQFPLHSYASVGSYDVSLLVYTKRGCIDSSYVIRNNAVNVYPRPVSNFTATPHEASIFDPKIIVMDNSEGHSSVSYDFGDGFKINRFNAEHFYLDTGEFSIIHRAYNEYGCLDSTLQTIRIFPGYIPNSFTPNKDQKNDFFYPVFLASSDFTMEIYNRWGEMIFVTNSLEQGWDGYYLGKEAPIGTYLYKIKAGSTNGKTYYFSGHVNLIR